MAKHRGRGVATINYPIGMNLGGDPSQALVHSNPTGKFTVALSSIDLGQGMKSVTRQICAETLGVPVEDVYVDTADSDTGPHCMGSFASRGTHRVGNAVMAAAREARGGHDGGGGGRTRSRCGRPRDRRPRQSIRVKGAPHRSISVRDVAIAAQFRQGKTISGRGIFLVPLSDVDPETGEMSPATCYAHACLIAEVEVDDETGDVAVLKMTSTYELGRALNPKLVEQQLVGGAWMGMSHALYETPEPYYPDTRLRAARFQRISDAGPGRHLSARHHRARASGARRPVRRQGSGRDVRQSGAARRRQRDLQRRRRAHQRSADHAGKSPARPESARRRGARPRRGGGKRSWRCGVPSSASAVRRRWRRRCARPITSPTRSFRPRPISRWRWASRCCSKARRASARPKPPRRSPAVLGRDLAASAMLRRHRRRGGALRMEFPAPDAGDAPGRRRQRPRRHLPRRVF